MLRKLIFLFLYLIATQCGKLPIQAHSFNDLNYVTNLIDKGIDYFKLDVSMANRKSCQQFSTWNKSKKCLITSQYIQQICCLGLRGDASSRPSFGYNFNTSDELSKFFDTVLAKIVAYQPKRKLLFAINFQYGFSFDDFITEQFLSMLADIMAKYSHNILLGTGSDSFILEYDRICFGKGAPQCNDLRRKISKSNMFLQSGAENPFDPRDHYKRFRNFNIFYKGIDHHCKYGFPQWINNYPDFPLIFWEPSNQKQIQYVITRFLSPSCMRMHGRNLSGMAMASNIDPEMFDIYLKKTISYQPSSNYLPTALNASWSLLTQKVLLVQQNNVRMTKITIGNSQVVFTASTNLFTHKLLIQKWQYDQKNQSLKLMASRQYGLILSQSQIVRQLKQDGKNYLILITQKNQKQLPFKIYYFNVTSMDLVSTKDWQRIQAVCMRDNEIIYVNCDNSYQNCTIKGSIELKQAQTYARFNIKMFMTKITSIQSYDKDFVIVGHDLQIKGLSSALWINQGRIKPPILPLSLGQNPKIFKKQFGKQYGVLLSNSMCHSALLINNNDMNKCNFFKQPEFQSLRNVRGLLNLLEFNMTDLLKNQQIVSPCHQKISLTKLMNGGDADIIQFMTAGSYLISSQYIRIQDQDLVAALFCGGSNFDKAYRYTQKSSMISSFYLTNRNNNTTTKTSSDLKNNENQSNEFQISVI